MVEYHSYPHANMSSDFDLYPPQEQHLDFMPTSQPFMPTTSYNIDPAFSAPYEVLPVLSGALPRHQDLRFHYDAIAQGVKPIQYTPTGSPNSSSHSFQDQPPILSASSESGASVSSSTMASPSLNPQYNETWDPMSNGLGLTPGYEYGTMSVADKVPGCVASQIDPNLIQPFGNPMQFNPHSPYPEMHPSPTPYFPVIEHPPSPALSQGSHHSQRPGSKQFKRGSQSPYLHTQQFQPYPSFNGQRRRSDASLQSQHSATSRKSGSSYELDDETREKGMCPLPECGRVFKDLKAHMLTHQNERPEKCPIATCEYHLKGFARKYDKNRHTLTHYKGTMVCGFCPGSGSASEKSFNRADVFKRHLTSVHGVEQNPPNSRKKSPTGRKAFTGTQQTSAGTCSTCSVTFCNAQEFYEHLDDCVLRVVQQAEPSEAINQRLLTSVAEDKDVTETLDRNGLSNSVEYSVPSFDNDEEDEEDEEEIDVEDHNDDTYGTSGGRGPRAGLTFSKGGVAITGSGRKKRKNYPVAWGCPTDKMKMKKRVLTVYDGQRRLLKDDMMLNQEFEVRMKLPDGKSYVTDLDIQTLKRADAFHGTTPEERGPWVPDNVIDNSVPNVTDIEQYMI
ncbi:hypothetical protein BDV95DRAFT_630896 [Massariosphaeria phaeospora]|uniref:C2H2-type domain-containing protein n=1 Tax=Massariosphaeria phaeospora TaxID=100035 RepID=A0A7C8MA63_9PLEO|nr:hypothetical protein BDV95DRAFT_630896 [Massariosphaeria phaeospora]